MALALGVTTLDSAAAQSRGSEFDGDRSGPPPYFTGQSPRRDFDRPADWPPADGSREQQSSPPYRRAGPSPPMPDDRRSRIITKPPVREAGPPPRGPQEREGGPVARVAVGADQMVISIAEYRSLQDQARELQRLRGSSRDFHEERPSRDQGPREIYR